jgi:hypothetical protein
VPSNQTAVPGGFSCSGLNINLAVPLPEHAPQQPGKNKRPDQAQYWAAGHNSTNSGNRLAVTLENFWCFLLDCCCSLACHPIRCCFPTSSAAATSLMSGDTATPTKRSGRIALLERQEISFSANLCELLSYPQVRHPQACCWLPSSLPRAAVGLSLAPSIKKKAKIPIPLPTFTASEAFLNAT